MRGARKKALAPLRAIHVKWLTQGNPGVRLAPIMRLEAAKKAWPRVCIRLAGSPPRPRGRTPPRPRRRPSSSAKDR
jgi:hypothetical protein